MAGGHAQVWIGLGLAVMAAGLLGKALDDLLIRRGTIKRRLGEPFSVSKHLR